MGATLVLSIAWTVLERDAAGAPDPPPMVELNPMPIADPDADAAREAALAALDRRLRPRALSAETVEAWGAAVDMDPEAMAQLREAISLYRTRIANLDADPRSSLTAQIVATHRWNRRARTFEPEYTPEYLDLLELQWQAIERLRAAERDLLASFVALAPPEFGARARRIAFARQFELVAVPTVRNTAAINVAAIVDALRLDDETWQLVDAVLDTYVQRMTAALGWRTEAAFGLHRDHARLLVELGPLWELGTDEAEREEVRAELAEIHEALVRTELPISGLNDEALQMLSRALPPAQAAEVRRRFWRLVNSELHREEAELTAIILESMGNDGLEPADVTGREALLETMQADIQRHGFTAADLEDIARTIDPTTSTVDAVRYLGLERQRLDAMARRRRELLGAAASLERMLTTSEGEVLGQVRIWSAGLERRTVAERWISQRLSEVGQRVATRPAPVPEPSPQPSPDSQPDLPPGPDDGPDAPESSVTDRVR